VILGGPPAVVLLLLLFRYLTWAALICTLREIWGSVASVWGLVIGIYVLAVAIGVRRAAEDARLRAKRYDLTEELEAATHRIQEVGHFLATGNWDVVRIRSEEVSNTCQRALGKWVNDPLRKKSRDNLILADKIMRSIAERSATALATPLTPDESRDTKVAQLKAGGLLQWVVGETISLQDKE